MPNFIRTALAATVSAGVLALAPVGIGTHGSSAAAATPASSTPQARKLLIQHRVQVRNTKVNKALRVATSRQGSPYRWGATGPRAFDCSGLMLYSFRAAGLHLPRTSAAQAGAVRHIARSHMHRGDLVFFRSGGHVYHVGMFDGWRNGHRIILHAPHTGAKVRKEAIWTNSWFAGTMRLG